MKTSIYIRKIIISNCLIILALTSSAQKLTRSLEISHSASGSGLGENICLGMGFNKGNSTLSFGANFQRKNIHLSGIQVTFRYVLIGIEHERIQLYFSGNLTYHASAFMSKRIIEIENNCNPQENHNYEKLSLKVIESYAAFGLKLNHSERISTMYSTGFGLYNTLNKDYDIKMYRLKSSTVLQFRFTLIYNLN